MWTPESVAEIESAIDAGTLVETASFDGKAILPPIPAKNIDLAIDVAAMSTDGGVLLYGVKEDRNGRLTIQNPIELAGARERIAQIVETSVAEVPVIDIRPYPTDSDPSVGYLIVLVPQSPRAPHQVVVGSDLRFYGRGATGNRILTEHEIALLYERRQSRERDRDVLLDEVIKSAPFEASDEFAFLHALARPVVSDQGLWDRAVAAAGGHEELLNRLRTAGMALQTSDDFDPRFNALSRWDQLGADAVRLSALDERMRQDKNLVFALDAVFEIDGAGRLFSSRAAFMNEHLPHPHATKRIILELVIAGNLASFLTMLGTLYRLSHYHGQVDIGAAVTGLTGAQSMIRAKSSGYFFTHPYAADSYRRTTRVAASQLEEPKSIVRSMFRGLFNTATGQSDFDPFT